MAVHLAPSDYLDPRAVLRRERAARLRSETDIGLAYEAYAYATPGSNPYRYGFDADPVARHDAMAGQRGSVAAEVARVFNSQLPLSLERFVNRVMAELFPDGAEWAHLEPGDRTDPETAPTPDEARERETARNETEVMLEPIQRSVFQDLHRSNFAEQAPHAIMDACVWRVGVLRVQALAEDEGRSALAVQHVSQAECAFEWGPDDTCWGVYRRHYFTQEECEYYWPDGSGWQFGEGGQDGLDGRERRIFTEAAYKVRGKTTWAYQVVQEADDQGIDCVRRGYKRNPYIVFGVKGPPGGRLTRSIVEVALATAKSLNAMTRITMESAEWQATPTFTVAAGGTPNRDNLEIRPGVTIPVHTNAREAPSLQRLDVGGSPDVGWASEERMEMQIQRLCYDESLPPDQPQPKTATEIIHRIKELKQTLGAVYSKLMNGLGTQILQHFLDALYELKEVEGMNREGGDVAAIELDGKEVKVAFNNPLNRAQRLTDVEDVMQWLESLIAVMPQQMLTASVNLEALPEYTGRLLSIPEHLYRKPKEMEALVPQAIQAGLGAPAATPGIPGGGERPGAVAEGGQLLATPTAAA